MTDYEVLLDKAYRHGLTVTEKPFVFHDGLIKNKKIGIRKSIPTSAQKADVLAEEIANSQSSAGNILDQTDTNNRKQEHRARIRAYDMRIGLDGIVRMLEFGCSNSYEAAEYLGCGEEFFREALHCYGLKYGICTKYQDYTIVFEPSLMLIKDI